MEVPERGWWSRKKMSNAWPIESLWHGSPGESIPSRAQRDGLRGGYNKERASEGDAVKYSTELNATIKHKRSPQNYERKQNPSEKKNK